MCTFVYVYPEAIWVGLLSMLASAFAFHSQQLKVPLLSTFRSSVLHSCGAAVSLPGVQTWPSVLCSWLTVGTDRRCTLCNTAH